MPPINWIAVVVATVATAAATTATASASTQRDTAPACPLRVGEA
jgi:hypothetical protein